MKCPKCNGKASCVDSRDTAENARRRRWVCKKKKCGVRFSTIEQVADVGDQRHGPIKMLTRFRKDQAAGQTTVALKVIRQRVLEAFDSPYVE